MRILRIIASADPAYGGPVEGISRVGEALGALGHVQDVASLDAPDAAFLKTTPARVIPLGDRPRATAGGGKGRPPLWRRFGFAPRAVPWLQAHVDDYDVTIVSGMWNYSTVAARRVLVGGGKPYVVFTHGMLDPWFKQAYPVKSLGKQAVWLVNEGPLLSHAGAVLFTTEEEKLRARGAFWPYRARERVVAYGTADITGDPAAQIAAFRATLPALGERRYLLFMSRIHEKKGIDLLIDAYARVAAAHPAIDLAIVGPDDVGLRAGLEARAAAHGLARRIHWPGMVEGDVKFGALRGCDAFVLPSHQENFGIVVAEAMAAGRPVLISDKVNIWREIEKSQSGFVAADTVEGTTTLLTRLLKLSDTEREAMGARARDAFAANFSIAEAASSLLNVLEEVAGAAPAGRPRTALAG